MGRPVVSSPAAAEGIDAQAGRELLVAVSPREAADCIVSLVDNPAIAHGIGQAARARMEMRYGWEATLAPLRAIISGEAA